MKRTTTMMAAVAATLLAGTGVALGHGMGWGGGGYGPGMGYGAGGAPCYEGAGMRGFGPMSGFAGATDARLADLKTALKLTDAQKPVWQKFEDTVKNQAEARAKLHAGMLEQRGNPESMTAYRESMWAYNRDAAAEFTKARSGLYDALTVEQRVTADRYIGWPGYARR